MMKLALPTLLVLGLLSVASGSLAQESRSAARSDTSATPADTSSVAVPDSLLHMGMLDVIVVTASRTEQPVKDAPKALEIYRCRDPERANHVFQMKRVARVTVPRDAETLAWTDQPVRSWRTYYYRAVPLREIEASPSSQSVLSLT